VPHSTRIPRGGGDQLGHPPIQTSPAKSLTTPPHYREETVKFKDDYRIDRLIELMRQESVLINEEILIYREIAELYGERVSQRLKEAMERDMATRRRHHHG
jgi:hypothetical protein